MNRFKYIYYSIVKGALACSLLAFVGCTKDFESINKNPLDPDAQQKEYDGVGLGGYFTDFQKRVIPTRSPGESTDRPNEYQVMLNLASDNWIGYFSPMVNKFNNGNNFTTYYMIEGWVNYAYSTSFNNIINTWMQIKDQTHIKEKTADGKVIYKNKDLLNQSVFSLAQIIKIQALHRTTDMFGPMPYSKIGLGQLKVPYDSQESIYRSFLAELEEAVQTLTNYSASSKEIIADFDGVYHGDVKKWIKLGNSLMLRLAMRVRYADPELAKKYAITATTHPGGTIDDVAEIACLKNSTRFNYLNSLKLIWDSYSDTRMGATIYSYLKGFGDSRIDSYFRRGKAADREDFFAIRTGIPQQSKADFYKNYSVPNVEDDTPVYWFKASEVLFLKAEAALYGLIQGNSKDFYEKGVAKSFEENNVRLGSYLSTKASSGNYDDVLNPTYSATAPSKLSKVWDQAQTDEEHLEQIITQKYIAIFPDGQEAWSEWRRTGYPKQITAFENRTNAGVVSSDGYKYGVRRFPFPLSEKQQNKDNVNAALPLLQGPDNSATRLWWDKNPLLN
ncbi:RagB/SusD family nutrient uptake outer membrane protein [Porphyromonas pogonae]|uniref:RagB/SusD family nutrient uptake outer membrane protein n=1 Tax=Porphyromonas pogonae TaxID=867595 RepID=UPI002E7A9F98|nr:RagB/SusD family nutrient uptake outer membrane protein [Porphyromonas pogonae]